MKKLLLAAILFFGTPPAWANVSLNNANTIQTVAANTFSGSMSVTAGCTNCVAFVIADFTPNAGAINTITYGGNTMTSAGTRQVTGTGTAAWASVWYLINPPTGSNTLAITGNGSVTQIITNLISFSGVDQTTPVRVGTYQGTNANSSATISQTITSAVTDLTFSTTVAGSSAPSLNTSNQTSDGISNSGAEAAGSDHATTAAASVTHTWTYSASSASPAMIGFSIAAAVAPPSGSGIGGQAGMGGKAGIG